jgi:hypothetical protein
MTPDDIANLAQAAQSSAVAIAVIIGGTWTLYTFIRLRTVRRARAELHKLQLESAEQAVVSIDVRVEQMDRYSGPGYVLSGAAVVTNKGNRNTRIDFSAEDSCSITRVDFNGAGQAVDRETFNVPLDTTYYLRSGAMITFPFIARVQSPGVYRVDVKSPLHSPDASQAAATSTDGQEAGYIWVGLGFIAVSEVPR